VFWQDEDRYENDDDGTGDDRRPVGSSFSSLGCPLL